MVYRVMTRWDACKLSVPIVAPPLRPQHSPVVDTGLRGCWVGAAPAVFQLLIQGALLLVLTQKISGVRAALPA